MTWLGIQSMVLTNGSGCQEIRKKLKQGCLKLPFLRQSIFWYCLCNQLLECTVALGLAPYSSTVNITIKSISAASLPEISSGCVIRRQCSLCGGFSSISHKSIVSKKLLPLIFIMSNNILNIYDLDQTGVWTKLLTLTGCSREENMVSKNGPAFTFFTMLFCFFQMRTQWLLWQYCHIYWSRGQGQASSRTSFTSFQ